MVHLGRPWLLLAAAFCGFAVEGFALDSQTAYPFGKGLYNGLIYSEEGIIPEHYGFFKINVTRFGHFSGQFLIGPRDARFSGYLDGSGYARVRIRIPEEPDSYSNDDDWWYDPPEERPLTWTIELQVFDEGSSINGRVTYERGLGWTSALSGVRASYDRLLKPAPQAGKYSFVLPGSSDPEAGPSGESYGTITVDAGGKVTLKAALANGAKVTHSAWIGAAQASPLYEPMHDGLGMLVSWVGFAGAQTNGPSGAAHWVLPGREGINFYSGGFYLQSMLTGSPFQKRNEPLVGSGSLDFVIAMGSASFTNKLAMDSRGKLTNTSPNPMAIQFSPQTGEFKGWIQQPETGLRLRFGGEVLQNQNAGFGYFLGERVAGEVRLE